MKPCRLLTPLLAAHAVLAAIITRKEDLYECAVKALKGTDTAKRVVAPSDDTYTDARLGEKIQYEDAADFDCRSKMLTRIS